MRSFRTLLGFVFLMMAATAIGQGKIGTVKGNVIDTATKKFLPSATINILDAKDSTLVTFGRSKENGSFEISRLAVGKYLLLITYTGFDKFQQTFSITNEQPVVDLPVIAMTSNATLDGVTVVAAPVAIKGDTVEFNAASFKVNKPNAVVEDLLKRLPGVEVASDGTIKANGQEVKRILVDGKQFFADDPKLATKNLQADMVNKVQVFEKKSDKSEFTGFDDGNTEPTINLTLKNDKRQGVFGRIAGGYGTDNRYQTNTNINSFKKGEQISLIGQANNINQQGFSVMDALSFSGGGFAGGGRGGATIAGAGGGSQGITATQAIGLNYNNFKSSKLDLNTSYFFNGTQLENNYDLQRLSYIGDTTQNYKEPGFTGRNNNNHRINMSVDWKMDSSNSIIVRPSVSFQNTESETRKTYSTTGSSGNLLSDGESLTKNNSNGYNVNGTVLWRHKFDRAGRTFSAQLNFGRNESDADGSQFTINNRYKGSNITRDTIRQVNTTKSIASNYGVDLSYTEPMSRRSIIELNAFYRANESTNERKTFDYNAGTQAYDKVNSRLTNFFDNEYTYAGGGLTFKENRTGWNYSIGAKAQQATLSSLVQGKTEPISQSFFNILPSAQIQIGKNRFRNFRLFYNGATQNPSVTQLQPIEDISDPLNITKGNPNLKQAFTNNFRANYSSFDPYTMKSFFLFANVRQTLNGIVNSDSIGQFGGRYTTYENVNGIFNANVNMSIGLPLPLGETRANINLNTGAGYSQNVNLLNKAENKISNINLSQGVSANYNYKELFDVSLGGNVAWTRARYSLQEAQNTNFFTYSSTFETNWYLPKNFTLGSDVTFTANTGRADGFNQSFTLWNAYIAKSVLKNKRGEIRLRAYDLLNQNTGISRVTSGNYVEDNRYTVLKRYFMLTFTFNLSKFGAAQSGSGQRMMMMGMPR
ncbi:MAG: outer membrane beta-barrel protein [Chitinophagaceae bacterium]|nr:outer membrane beta-barrel protein [Chitinophagaceae bacterium]